jgi:hypothetical protein
VTLYLASSEFKRDKKGGAYFPPSREYFRAQLAQGGQVNWRRFNGKMVDTGEFRFVIDIDGTIYLSDLNDELDRDYADKTRRYPGPARPRFHHGSLIGDEWPAFAGRGWAGKGYITLLNNHTGHFRQPRSTFEKVFRCFEQKGFDVRRAKELWYEGNVYLPQNPNKVAFTLHEPLSIFTGDICDKIYGVYSDSEYTNAGISPSDYKRALIGAF